MTPRKVSVRVAHQRGCANASKTALSSVGRKSGCTCSPSFYTFHRDRNEKVVKGKRYPDREFVEKLAVQIQHELNQGRAGYEQVAEIDFPEWANKFENEVLPIRGVKASTRRTYADTLAVARDEIGYVPVRRIGPEELRRFHARFAHTSPASQLKQLRQLSACLSAAVDEGYADRNPVTAFRKQLRLRAESGTPPYSDDELARLYLRLRREERVYLTIVRLAVETGARIGELIALDWSNVALLGKPHIWIRHTWNPLDGLTTPKDRDDRIVHLTPRAQRVLRGWVQQVGVRDDGPVFEAPRSGERVNADYLRKVINRALDDAGIPKIDPVTLRPRKPAHSLRASYARRMLEQGRHPQWVEAQLGHSDLRLTMHTYGRWSEEAMYVEAQRR